MASTYIIAEAGVNHNGSLDLAFKLIDAAVEAGSDAVKFQSFKAEELASKKAPKADYQKSTTSVSESQYEMLKKLELSAEAHHTLIQRCKERGITFLSTPFDLKSLHLLTHELDLARLKLGSGELTNAPLLLAAARSKKPIILSTGMSTLEEIETALGVLAFGYLTENERPSIAAFKSALSATKGKRLLTEKLTLLHCTTEYPAPFNEVNLFAMNTLKQKFGIPVGFSDHTPGISAATAAVALGAVLIEKHLTLDKKLPGPDHQASLNPDEFEQLVTAIRQTEQVLGSASKQPTASELKNMPIARKSLVARKKIRKGEAFSEENLTAKRPGNGIHPIHYWEWLGKTATRDYSADDLIEP